ncbi:MAG TPA: hypothetical protein VJQ46_01065 [Gemmatimonadales bacterium]|nr:hypothetical protein [Gemmatimonadales bacterium]
MPLDACVYFWDCPACHMVVKPKAGRLLCVLLLRVGALPAEVVRPHSPPAARGVGVA